RRELKVSYYDQMPYETMINHARRAAMLFLPPLDSSYAGGLISAKIFDYLALRRPVIAFSPEQSDISQILAETESGKAFGTAQVREAAGYIRDVYLRRDKDGVLLSGNETGLKKYATDSNAKALSGLFNALAGQFRRPSQ
ncbi:MAG: hypothetical protein PHD63_07460, partial [Candidatus Marinimicrobia bacterium]|nr:hypothetical protein [Candidatus Neomarinimicrobiota bacterium]